MGEVKVKVTAEEQELIFRGIRPKNMLKEVYKQVRNDMKKHLKYRLNHGKYLHISVGYIQTEPELATGDSPKVINVGKGTYVREGLRNFELRKQKKLENKNK